MPEYLAPGVYVEETSFRSKSIEGVSTSTCGLIGPTLEGLANSTPELLTSLSQFERIYGGNANLPYGPNYLAHSVRAYFANGGRRLYVARVVAKSGDSVAPDRAAYEAALAQFQTLDEISTLAAPGHSAYPDHAGIRQVLLDHVQAGNGDRHRFLVLDTPPGQPLSEVRAMRAALDCKYAALYYPWVIVKDPSTTGKGSKLRREIALPPSGFICGIYARTDIERGVHKAPADGEVRGMLRFERDIGKGEQELLNPIGINCLRNLEGHGNRVWGARTLSNDPEWKYVNVRRYFDYLEHSIDRGTQWVVFEPNGEPTWIRLRAAIEAFLYNEWRNGTMLGTKPDDAFFVRCDRSTMTQNDLDNGKLVCLIGVAPLKPAEFIIFRFAQQTGG